MLVWSRNTVRENSHVSFFWGGDPFCWVVRRPEKTYGGADRFAWMTSGSLPSVQNYRHYCLFKSHAEKWTSYSPHVFSVYGWLSEFTYFHFFPVICWSYLRTEISFIRSTGNKLHFSLSCETTLLVLSCDRIESAKLIHSTPSPAKLVYYISLRDKHQQPVINKKNDIIQDVHPYRKNSCGDI